MIRFGVFGIILSVALIAGAVILMIASPEIAEPLVCKDHETLETRSFSRSDSRGNATVTNFYCVDNEGVARDVSAMLVIPFVAASIILPFFFVFFIVAGARRKTRRTLQAIPGFSVGNFSSVDHIQEQLKNMPGVTVSSVEYSQPDQQDIDAMLKGIGALKDQLKNMSGAQGVVMSTQSYQADGESLVDKLKQLQQAHTMGLISQEEFDATKKELLDKMTGNET
jgi:hypothetical protein